MINLPNLINDHQKTECSKMNVQNKIKPNFYDYFSVRIPRSCIENVIKSYKDERFLFFMKYGILRRYEGECDIIYIELPQIPQKLVIYRRPQYRMKSIDRLSLGKKDLPHIPLFEGEDHLKYLSLELNQIKKIDPLVSLNNLLYLNLYGNQIKEIENLTNISKVRVLLLGKNKIEKIENLNNLTELEILDLHSNNIETIENLNVLKKLRVLNLANNLITSIKELYHNKNLEELNVRKNLIDSIPNMTNNFYKLKKINLGKNLIDKFEYLIEFTKLNFIEEVIIENNPVLNYPNTFDQIANLTKTAKTNIFFSRTNIKNNSNNKCVLPFQTLTSKSVNLKKIRNNENNYHHDVTNFKSYNIYNNIKNCQSINNSRKSCIIKGEESLNNISFIQNKNSKLIYHYKELSYNCKDVIYARNKRKINDNNRFPINLTKSNFRENKIKKPIINEDRIDDYFNKNDKKINKLLSTTTIINMKILNIKQLWNYEIKNIISHGYNGYNNEKYKEINVDQGYYEVEGGHSISLYGNCLKSILKKDFYEDINTLSFNYFYYDYIVNKKVIETLNEYKNLISLKFSHNNLFSSYQLVKLELFNNIQNLNINDNEVCSGYLLKYFVIYRLNTLKTFNGKEIKNEDQILSKEIFQVFDKIISIKEEEDKNKIEFRNTNNKNDDNNNLLTTKENENINIKENIISEEFSLQINKLKFFDFIKFYLEGAVEQIIDDEDKRDMQSN